MGFFFFFSTKVLFKVQQSGTSGWTKQSICISCCVFLMRRNPPKRQLFSSKHSRNEDKGQANPLCAPDAGVHPPVTEQQRNPWCRGSSAPGGCEAVAAAFPRRAPASPDLSKSSAFICAGGGPRAVNIHLFRLNFTPRRVSLAVTVFSFGVRVVGWLVCLFK